MRFNWQNPKWPNFKYDLSAIQDLLYHYAIAASSLAGGRSTRYAIALPHIGTKGSLRLE